MTQTTKTRGKYSVWLHHEEQWDANDIDPPDLVVEAFSPGDAAEMFAKRRVLDDEIAVVVRDESDGKYYQLELYKVWEVDLFHPTTLEELCSP